MTTPAPTTVPVQVDSGNRNSPVARCTYFCIDCQVPQPGWTINFGGQDIPFLLVGVSGILVSPLNGAEFTDPQQIDDLFSRIEAIEGFSVEVNDLWLPTWVFTPVERSRGQVYRMGVRLFQHAFADRFHATVDEATWAEFKHEWNHSPLESAVFGAWERRTIQESINQYPKNKSLALSWRRPDDGPGAPAKNRPLDGPPGAGGSHHAGFPPPPPTKYRSLGGRHQEEMEQGL